MNFKGSWITACGVKVIVDYKSGIIWRGHLGNSELFWDLYGNNPDPKFDLVERVRDAKL